MSATPVYPRAGALGLFAATGIELEYMIVDQQTLAVRPIADALLEAVAGADVMDVERGSITWSNELALHLIELKTTEPARALAGVVDAFAGEVRVINEVLAGHGARLMPSAMHPTMDPRNELRLWPHEANEIYAVLHRIFDCTGHGWANLQSAHINLPFADDREFSRLHAAIRLILPLIPALAASSPICDGRATGLLDTRLEVYRTNAARIPSITGLVIPEAALSRDEYLAHILEPMYRDIAAHDPEGIVQHEWLNARGSIARFERQTIEIRVVDVQECPAADLAVAAAIVAAVRGLTEERLSSFAEQHRWSEQALEPILRATTVDADGTYLDQADYLHALGFPGQEATASEVWQHLVEATLARQSDYPAWRTQLDRIFRQGCLARRMLNVLGGSTEGAALVELYRSLCDCLEAGTMLEV